MEVRGPNGHVSTVERQRAWGLPFALGAVWRWRPPYLGDWQALFRSEQRCRCSARYLLILGIVGR
eukprot:3438925-Alexandrium_andersonii.AAC.1